MGAVAVVEVLLDARAPSKSDGYEGNHPFAIAAEHGHAKVVAVLARRGVAENVVAHALFHSVFTGQEEVVRTILEMCKPPVPQRVLEISTWWKDGKIFKRLLEYGADVNAANDG
jgi:hypothetical protein